MAECNPSTLLQSAQQFAGLGSGQLQAIIAQLLCDIAVDGAGGGGGGGLAGAGSPEGVVSASPGTTYLDTTTDGFWVKKTGTGNTGWIQLIA